MGSVGPSQPYGNDPNQLAAQTEAEARRIREEVEITALGVFLASVNPQQNEGDSKQGKIDQIENEVKQGLLTPSQAAAAMFSIVNEAMLPTSLNLPNINPDLSKVKSQVLLHVEFFSLFLDQNKAYRGVPPILEQAVAIANQLQGDRISPQEGATSLENLIFQVNHILPSHLQYPKTGPKLFGLSP